jgi:phage gp46-like protein
MDVRLYQTNDGGEIDFVSGAPVMGDGLESAVFLSLFGGNEDDSGLESDDSKQFWGNLSEPLTERRFRSETQALLNASPVLPANLIKFQDAAEADLTWMVDTGLATFVSARASIPALNTVQLDLSVEIDGKAFHFTVVQTSKTQ